MKNMAEMSSNSFFCPANSPKHQDSLFIIINDKDRLQIPTFKKPQTENIGPFYKKKSK